nr:DUF4102 domain-containing protein [Bartonella kosoyi]
MPRAVATLGAGKWCDDAGLLLHKRKDGSAQWILRYTLHKIHKKAFFCTVLRHASISSV